MSERNHAPTCPIFKSESPDSLLHSNRVECNCRESIEWPTRDIADAYHEIRLGRVAGLRSLARAEQRFLTALHAWKNSEVKEAVEQARKAKLRGEDCDHRRSTCADVACIGDAEQAHAYLDSLGAPSRSRDEFEHRLNIRDRIMSLSTKDSPK